MVKFELRWIRREIKEQCNSNSFIVRYEKVLQYRVHDQLWSYWTDVPDEGIE